MCSAAIAPAFLLSAQDTATQPQQPPPTQPTPERIRQWAQKLGDDSPQVRDEATRRLIEAGSAAVEEVRKRTAAGDAEIESRAERILDAIENKRLKAVDRRTIFLDKEKKVKLDLVWIKPGKFTMGSNEGNNDEVPPHEVTISKGFRMGATQVTQDQWQAVMGSNPSKFMGSGSLPVESVSWNDCQEFLAKANRECELGGLKMDLPTEAEWGYACRAGSKTKWSFGDDERQLGDCAWHRRNSGGKTHPVGEKKPNAWGLYDMHGNVLEWCKDYYGSYGGDVVDPKGPDTGQYRVLRGGSWNAGPGVLLSASRIGSEPAYRFNYVGGRVVLRETVRETLPR